MHLNLVKRITVVILFFITTCSVKPPPKKIDVDFSTFDAKLIPMDSTIEIDSIFYFLLKPYADSLREQMSFSLGETPTPLSRLKPESSLGNVIAESLRDYASLLRKTHVEIGLINIGGLRTDLAAGKITVGSIYELMPFENKLTILTLSGYQLESILNDIALIGGEPVSGVRFRISNQKAKDIIVSGQPLHKDSLYTLATSDYLVNGGGSIRSLAKYVNREDTNILIRDIIIEYVKNRRVIQARIDGRVRL